MRVSITSAIEVQFNSILWQNYVYCENVVVAQFADYLANNISGPRNQEIAVSNWHPQEEKCWNRIHRTNEPRVANLN
jgi:hypothetical protein